MSKVNTKKPELADFGIKPEEYALYSQRIERFSWRSFSFALNLFLFLFVVIYVLLLTKWESELGIRNLLTSFYGSLMISSLLPGLIVIAGVCGEVGNAIARSNQSRLFRSPVASQIKLYERAIATYAEEEREAERQQREDERARRGAETARLKAERAQRRKLEDYWMSLSGADFERELGNVMRALGYRVESTPSSGDDGVDLILKRPGKTIVVQCKAHRNPVGPAIARELLGSMIHFKADQAILACTGGFTRGVMEFVRDKPIDLISVSRLARLGAQVEGKDIRDTPICTKCAKAMVLKEGSYGVFWGCTRYPRCRETRDAGEW